MSVTILWMYSADYIHYTFMSHKALHFVFQRKAGIDRTLEQKLLFKCEQIKFF